MTQPTPSVTDAQRRSITTMRQLVAARQNDEAAVEQRYRQECAAAETARQAARQAQQQQTTAAENAYTVAWRDADARYLAATRKSADDRRRIEGEADAALTVVKRAYDEANKALSPIELAMPAAAQPAVPAPAAALPELRELRDKAPKLAAEIAEDVKWMVEWQAADAKRSQRLSIAGVVALILVIFGALLGYMEIHYRAGKQAVAAGDWASAQAEFSKARVILGYRDVAAQRYYSYLYPAQTAVAQRDWTSARAALEAAGTPVPGIASTGYSRSNDGRRALSSQSPSDMLIEVNGMQALEDGNVTAAALWLNQLSHGVMKPEIREAINNSRELRAALHQQKSPLLPPTGKWISSESQAGQLSLTLDDCKIDQGCGQLKLKDQHCSGSLVFAYPDYLRDNLRAYYFDMVLTADDKSAQCSPGLYEVRFDGGNTGVDLSASGSGKSFTAKLGHAY